jgi:hypothetical protein
LDLKQKQANILEAISGRKQAELARKQADATGRQSNIIMVFTVVTVIFVSYHFKEIF